MKGLGTLEAEVMNDLWRRHAPAPVREVHEALASGRDIAYTTVLTVLDNLHKKSFVTRTKAGRAWQYTAAVSREDYTAERLTDVVASAPNRGSAILRFVETLSPDEIAELRQFLAEEAPGGHTS